MILNLLVYNINTTSICVHFNVSFDLLFVEKLLPHPLMLRTNTQIIVLMNTRVCIYVIVSYNFTWALVCFGLILPLRNWHIQLTHTHHQVFCLPWPWSRSEKSPFRSIPSPRTPCCFCSLSPSQQPLTPSCQGLFPKIRLNMNIHKQNGTPRLWKLSKTYLHLILKEVPTPTLPPFTESSLPPFGPL